MRSPSFKLRAVISKPAKTKCFLLIAALLTATTVVAAQDTPTVTTCDLRNGRAWMTWSASTKTVYLAGLADALNRVDVQRSTTSVFRDYFSAKATWAELVSGIDKIYQDSANATLPIMDALSAFCERANGMSPDKLEEELARLRRQWRERGCEK
jgi:hypothetical protein